MPGRLRREEIEGRPLAAYSSRDPEKSQTPGNVKLGSLGIVGKSNSANGSGIGVMFRFQLPKLHVRLHQM